LLPSWLSFRLHHVIGLGSQKKVETEGFLRDGLQLYGDNAYVSPFKQVSSGPKDAFNFYHSQLRITVECAFGMLVHKWGCLRKPLPMNIPVSKQTRLVVALCKLHNFGVDQREKQEEICDTDKNSIYSKRVDFNLAQTKGLMNCWMDPDRTYKTADRASRSKTDLPVYKMLQYIEDMGYQRPTPQSTK
jgi:DDE superfamily endonuclease